MTKHDLAVELSNRMNIGEFGIASATQAIEHLIDIVSGSITRGESVYLRGFATIKPIVQKERMARNITKGTSVFVPAKKSVKLHPSKRLIKRLNQPL